MTPAKLLAFLVVMIVLFVGLGMWSEWMRQTGDIWKRLDPQPDVITVSPEKKECGRYHLPERYVTRDFVICIK